MQHLRLHSDASPATEPFRSPRWPRPNGRWSRPPALRLHGFDDDPITHVEKALASADRRAENLRALMQEFGIVRLNDGGRAA